MNSETGKITSWNDEKGFGFITPTSGIKQLFFHIKDFNRKHERPSEGLSVSYLLSKDSRGRICATDIFPEGNSLEMTFARRQKAFSVFISSSFLGVVTVLTLAKKLPIAVLTFYAAISILTFLVYYKDKTAARSGSWRTPENLLHLLSIIGGWPGAAIAQSLLRHKSKKMTFRLFYWLTAVINCTILALLLTTGANAKLFKIVTFLESISSVLK